MISATLSLDIETEVLEQILLEERLWTGGRASLDVSRQTVKISAPDAASLRAAINSVLKVIQVHQSMGEIQ